VGNPWIALHQTRKDRGHLPHRDLLHDAITDAHWNTADSLSISRNNCYAQQASTPIRKAQSKNTETKSQQNSKETTIPASRQRVQVPAQPKPRIKEVDTHEIRYVVGDPSGRNHNSSKSGGVRKQQSQSVVSQSAYKGTSKQTGGNQNDSGDAQKTEWVREVGGKKFHCVRSADQTICQ
jgi:hypothetical protein